MKVTEVWFCCLHLWHRLGEAGQRITFGWIRVTTLESSLSFESLCGFQEGGDRSEKIFTPHTYQRSVWRILWKPGVCAPWVYEAAALGCAWEGARSRQALGTGGWQSPTRGASKTLILNSSFCLTAYVCPPEHGHSPPPHPPFWVSGGPWCWPDHIRKPELSCILNGTQTVIWVSGTQLEWGGMRKHWQVLSLCFLICKMGYTSVGCPVRTQWENACEALSSVPALMLF